MPLPLCDSSVYTAQILGARSGLSWKNLRYMGISEYDAAQLSGKWEGLSEADQKRIKSETERLVKERLNYSIPVAKVNMAGIGSRGELIDNELPQLGEDFEKYRRINHLW